MAVYKVIQDVEAEDKLLGPLTLKGFIYAGIAAACLFIEYELLTIHTELKWIFIFMFLMPTALFGVLASPLGRDQPTEVWLLSKIRFFLKPRRRIWDQEGLEELVTVTAPKRIEQALTKDLSQSEVRSRLRTLASTLDTRGWAIKNVDTNLNMPTIDNPAILQSSDRLVANAGYTQAAPVVDIHAADDIMDEASNPTAQKFASMMEDADQKRRRDLMDTMKGLVRGVSPTVRHASSDEVLDERLASARASFAKSHTRAHRKSSRHHKLLGAEAENEAVPAQPETPKTQPAKKQTPEVTTQNQAVNMELAQSGSAFSVATLSKLANRQPLAQQTGPNEITISLH